MRRNEKNENIALQKIALLTSERGRLTLVVASQAVGVVAVYRPHRRPNPFVSGQSFHFLEFGAKSEKNHQTFAEKNAKFDEENEKTEIHSFNREKMLANFG